MRTTVNIDDAVLQAVKELAQQQQLSAGQVISRLLRSALTGVPSDTALSPEPSPVIAPLPHRRNVW